MHRVVVSSASKRSEPPENSDGLLWLGDRESKMLTSEFRHDGEARIEIVNVDFVWGELTGLKAAIERLSDCGAFKKVGSFPDCVCLVSGFQSAFRQGVNIQRSRSLNPAPPSG